MYCNTFLFNSQWCFRIAAGQSPVLTIFPPINERKYTQKYFQNGYAGTERASLHAWHGKADFRIAAGQSPVLTIFPPINERKYTQKYFQNGYAGTERASLHAWHGKADSKVLRLFCLFSGEFQATPFSCSTFVADLFSMCYALFAWFQGWFGERSTCSTFLRVTYIYTFIFNVLRPFCLISGVIRRA